MFVDFFSVAITTLFLACIGIDDRLFLLGPFPKFPKLIDYDINCTPSRLNNKLITLGTPLLKLWTSKEGRDTSICTLFYLVLDICMDLPSQAYFRALDPPLYTAQYQILITNCNTNMLQSFYLYRQGYIQVT